MAKTGTAALPVAEQKALVTLKNVNTSKYFAEFLGAYIFLFALFKLCFFLSHKYDKQYPVVKPFVSLPARLSRRILIRRAPILETWGHILTILVYWIVVLVLAITLTPGLPYYSARNWFPKRLGWITLLNWTATMFFSMKNTPVSFLTGYSHERLNVLHRTAGWTTLVSLILHWTVYAAHLAEEGSAAKTLTEPEQIYGHVAGVSLIILAIFSSKPIRQRYYELFVKVHTIGYLLVVIFVALHRPDLSKPVIWIVFFVVACYFLSRLVRGVQMVYNSHRNSATIIPLEGATKLVLAKTLPARPGDHIFVTIPAIRLFESHPFTISDLDSTQLRVRRREGFTSALHEYAKQHPGTKLRVLIEGPFGTGHDVKNFDKVILTAGGVGATYMFAVALDVVRQKEWNCNKQVEMIWVIKSEAHIDWFSDEIQEIQDSERMKLSIHVTRPGQARKNAIPEKIAESKELAQLSTDLPNYRQEEGKPDIRSLISHTIKSASKTDQIIVSSCGPKELMDEVRNAVAKNIPLSGPSVTLQNQQFGW